MNLQQWPLVATSALFALVVTLSGAFAQDAPKKNAEKGKNVLTIVDGKGKEQTLSSWKFVEGAQQLTWLASTAAPSKKDAESAKPGDKAPPRAQGPLALAFREKESTSFKDGVQTLIPLTSLRSLEYDYEKKTATAKVASEGGKDVVLSGSAAEFVGINTITIVGEIDLGELGVAEVKYRGGVKGGIQAIRFSAPEALPPEKGVAANVTINDAGEKKEPHKTHRLQVLYQTRAGKRVLAPTMFFRKSIQVELKKLKKLTSADKNGKDWTLALGEKEVTLTLLDPAKLGDENVFLMGFFGRTGAGYKLFPPHTVVSIEFESTRQVN